MKCKLLHDTPAAPTIPPNKDIMPAGTIIDHPNAFLLVQIGMAVSMDEECEAKADRTPEQLKQARYEHLRTKTGIHPDHYHLYDSGQVLGYNPDGSYKPGPNFVKNEEEESNLILPEGYEDEEENENDE